MRIIDAQIHLWSKGTVVPPHRTTPYLLDEALRDMDAAGVDGAILASAELGSGHRIAQAVEAARLHPDRFAILGRIPLDQPDKRGEIETWRQQPGMLGLRYTFLQPHMKSWPTDGTMDWLWPAAERLGLPVALLAGEFLPLVGKIAERHPGLRLIVDHFGVKRGNKDDAAFVTMPQVGCPGEASQHRRQGDRRAAVRDRRLSVQEPAEALSRDLRRVRAAAHVLGHRHHAHALQLAGVRHAFTEHQPWLPEADWHSSWAGHRRLARLETDLGRLTHLSPCLRPKVSAR